MGRGSGLLSIQHNNNINAKQKTAGKNKGGEMEYARMEKENGNIVIQKIRKGEKKIFKNCWKNHCKSLRFFKI
jgi:hypothetical protein